MSADTDAFELPRHLSESDVRAAAEEAETLLDAQQLLRVDRTRTRRILRDRDLLDKVVRAGAASLANVHDNAGGNP